MTYPGNKQCQKEQHGAAAVSPRSGVSLHSAVPGRAIVRRGGLGPGLDDDGVAWQRADGGRGSRSKVRRHGAGYGVALCAPCVLRWCPRRRFPRKAAERPAEAENHAASQYVNDYCDAEDYPEFPPLVGMVRKKGSGGRGRFTKRGRRRRRYAGIAIR